MTLDLDAAFLAGFIVGTYDLRGESELPAYIKPYIERVMLKKDHFVGVNKMVAPDYHYTPQNPIEGENTGCIHHRHQSKEEVRCNGLV